MTSALIGTAFSVGDGAGWVEFLTTYELTQQQVIVAVFILFVVVVLMRLVRLQKNIDELKGDIILKAMLGSYMQNMPRKGESQLKPNEISIDASIHFQVWTNIDIDIVKVGLNIIAIRNPYSTIWKFWKMKRKKTVMGVPKIKPEGTMYFNKIRKSDKQPFIDNVSFKWRGEKTQIEWSDIQLLEFAMETRNPNRILRVLLDADLYEREATEPL